MHDAATIATLQVLCGVDTCTPVLVIDLLGRVLDNFSLVEHEATLSLQVCLIVSPQSHWFVLRRFYVSGFACIDSAEVLLVELTVGCIALPLWIVEELVSFEGALGSLGKATNSHSFVLSSWAHRTVEATHAGSAITAVCISVR